MIRYFISAVLTAVLWVALASPSFSQEGEGDLSPRPIGDKGWCTVTQETAAGEEECGFNSATSACERQVASFYEKGGWRFSGVTPTSDIGAICRLEERDSTLELYVGVAGVVKRCDPGFSRAGDACRRIPKCSTCDASQEVGNPINIVTGEKKDVRVDYQSADGRFVIKRHYNSAPFASFGSLNSMKSTFGHNWFLGNFPTLGADITHTAAYSNYYFSYPTGYSTRLLGNATVVRGETAAGALKSPFSAVHPNGAVSSGATGNRRVAITHNNGTIYNYDFPLVTGFALRGVEEKPVTVDFGEGYFHTYTYFDDGKLSSIVDSYGRTASFIYHQDLWRVPNGKEEDGFIDGVPHDFIYDNEHLNPEDQRQPSRGVLKAIVFPDGTYTEFGYDSVSEFNEYWGVRERLKKAVKFSSSGTVIHSESYHYEDERIPYALTGITDGAGVRFATWSYDDEGRANMSEHAGGVERVDIVHGDLVRNGFDPNTREVTNALGHTKTYKVNIDVYSYGIMSKEGEATPDVAATRETYAYGSLGGRTSKRDALSRLELSPVNSRGFPTSKTYAVGTSEEFTATYEWHPRFRRPTKTVMPGLTTDYVYDDEGRILEMLQTDTSSNAAAPREWIYTWAGSNLASVDGPLPGTVDVTRFTHDNERLLSVENELGHITEITAHNPIGAPERFIDPNGVETVLTYDARHRLTQIERAGAITQIGYTATDLTRSIQLPNGNSLTFGYNPARQLIAITNGAGERVDYTRNAMGGILSTKIPDSSGSIQYEMTLARDEINRVIQATGVNSITKFAYDEMNNLTEIVDPRDNTWEQNFDNLDRLTREIDPLGGTTSLDLDDQMDGRNPLSKVTDQRGVETSYVRNGFGEVIREVSLEAGTTEYLRDGAGRIIQMTDARGVVSDYSYDGMDRLLSVAYPAAVNDNIAYGYDAGPYGIGELTSITEGFGTTTYGYNALAQMVSMTRDINGVSYTTGYEYDLAGETSAIIYPSGRRIEYARDGAARETQIRMVAPGGTATVLADNISYKPFGPINGMSLGDGHDLSIDYDANYRATRLQRAGSAGSLMDLGFTYDEAGDITGLQDYLRPERSQVLGYDALSRLTDAAGGYGTLNYGYNAGGDRETRNWTQPDGSQKSETYSYDQMTARLLEVSTTDEAGNMTPIREFDYHASGQVSGDLRGANAYLYDLNGRGRLSNITRNGAQVAAYTHDESEQRIVKTANGTTLHYHYDLDGRLIAETNGNTGETLREYVWLGLMPIAVIDVTDEAPDTACAEEITALEAQITDRTTRLDNNAEAIAGLFDAISDKEDRISANEAAVSDLEALILDKDTRIATHAARIVELGDLITDKQSRIAANAERIDVLTASIADKESRIATNIARIAELTSLIAADEAELGTLDPAVDAARIAFLSGRLASRHEAITALITRNSEMEALNAEHATRITELTTRNTELAALITSHETRIPELSAANDTLNERRDAHVVRAGELTTRNAELAVLVTAHETRIDELSDRNLILAEQLAQFEAELIEAEANCETVAMDGLYYLHADHLGRPQFATDTSGTVVWDMGAGVTPFGDSVNLAGAFAQQLMFPGQYADLETGDASDSTNVTLSHNWHRTYDPTLGRYLQSDPIGLAGGLNRFAYVGGNPMGYVDPDGLKEIGGGFVVGGAVMSGFDFGFQISFDTETRQSNFSFKYGGLIGVGGKVGPFITFEESKCRDAGWQQTSVSEFTGNISLLYLRKEMHREHTDTLGNKLRTGGQPWEHSFSKKIETKTDRNGLRKPKFLSIGGLYSVSNTHSFSSTGNGCGCKQ